MIASRSPKGFFARVASGILIFSATCFFAAGLCAQDVKVSDSLHRIVANVDNTSGLITILSAGNNNGAVGLDPQLDFFHKSYFSCKIGSATFTNDEITTLTGTVPLNSSGVTTYIKDITGHTDTVRTIWYDTVTRKQNGVDIIQDVWVIPLDVPATLPAKYWYGNPAQAVISWRFHNRSNAPQSVSCQWLNDLQITDPFVSGPCKGGSPTTNSNDGPKVMTKWQYDNYWTQFPDQVNPTRTLPWFYIGFLWDLPGGPCFEPGLSAMGYLDYGAPLNTLKPSQYTMGEWDILACWTIKFHMGPNYVLGPGAPGANLSNNNVPASSDNAVLLEWPGQYAQGGKTVLGGKTSYGTGQYERCVGQLFSAVFYPHHLIWNPLPVPGHYAPNPAHIEKFVVNPTTSPTEANTKITLTVNDSLNITDSTCKINYGKSQTQPPLPSKGLTLLPGGVGYYDWYVCANPQLYCKGPVTDTLVFTGTCGNCSQTFVDQWPFGDPQLDGLNQCDLPIIVDCADLDVNPPVYTDTVNTCDSVTIHVHDSRLTDHGLSSVTWVPTPKAQAGFTTDPTKFKITGPFPPISACYGDKKDHIFYITKPRGTADTLLPGCFDFTFTDCIGNVSTANICIPVCIEVNHPDTLPPFYTLIRKVGAYDPKFTCDNGEGDNSRIDSFTVTDIHQGYKYDTGIDTIEVITSKNMSLFFDPFLKGAPFAKFTLNVTDSMQDGNICVRTWDMAKPPKPAMPNWIHQGNYTDTCVHYCPLPDTIAPRITIDKDPSIAGKWKVCVFEDRPWDRLIDEIFIVGGTNVHPGTIADTLRASTTGKSSVCFDMISDDTVNTSAFCIEAIDLAGNRTKPNEYCSNQGISHDTLPPVFSTIPIIPNPASPTKVNVCVIDTHFVNGSHYIWDTGLDKIWLTQNSGMVASISTPYTYTGPKDQSFCFDIRVRDTMLVDTVHACVWVHASDKAGNEDSIEFCYPYTADTSCPTINLSFNSTDGSVSGHITDSLISDRGLFHIWDWKTTNIDTLTLTPNGQKIQNFTLQRNKFKSTIVTLGAQDYWGSFFNTPNETHTCQIQFGIYVQNFHLKPGLNPSQNTKFVLPVYFDTTDNISLSQKGITDIEIHLSKSGSTDAIVLDSVQMAGTELAASGWAQPVIGNGITISGANNELIDIHISMPPGGKPIDVKNAVDFALDTDVFLLLAFHTLPSQQTLQCNIATDQIIFNKGMDSLYTGTCTCTSGSVSALMPAPAGAGSGASIVITGSCSPTLTTPNTKPSMVWMDPPTPNPFTHQTRFNYTVAEDGWVQIALYDMLGNQVSLIVNQYQKQGAYTLLFDAANISGGSYVARLATGGEVKSRKIEVQK